MTEDLLKNLETELPKVSAKAKQASERMRKLWGDPEWIARQSLAMRGKTRSSETKEKISKALLGRKLSEEHRRKVGLAFKGKTHSVETKQKMSKATRERNMGRLWSVETKQKMSLARKGKSHSVETKQRLSLIGYKHWQNPEYAERQMRACKVKPNKAELKLGEILQVYFPNQFKYVGDGKLIIGGKCPDFINIDGRKQVLELFGAHWHDIDDVARKIEHYKSYGFDCVVIWEDELKAEETVVKKCGVIDE